MPATTGLTDPEIARILEGRVPVVDGDSFGVCAIGGMMASVMSEHPIVAVSSRSQRLIDLEIAQLRCWAEYAVRQEFGETRAQQILDAPLPMITGTLLTTIVIKRPGGDWGYRNPAWRTGLLFAPRPATGDEPPLDLPDLLDLIVGAGSARDAWEDHKAQRPDLFEAKP